MKTQILLDTLAIVAAIGAISAILILMGGAL